MTPSHISYNVHGMAVPDVGKLKAHLVKINPTTLLIMDALGLAQEIKTLLPNCIIMHRDYQTYKGDDDLVSRVSPESWIDTQRERGNLNIWRVCLNEPPFNDKTITWLNRAIDYNEQFSQKLKLVVGGWAVGNPGPDDWGLAKSLLERCDKLREHVILQLHEYACGVITSGLAGGWPDNAGVQPGTTGGVNYIPSSKWPEDVGKITKWHCGRFNFMVRYCQNNNILPPRIILTEHGMDDVSDIKGWAEKLDKTAPYTSVRGWKSLRTQWGKWYGNVPGWSAEQVYFEMLAWADRAIYRNSPVEGQCIFSWGHSSDDWVSFDVSEAFGFQSLLETYAQQKPVESPRTSPLPMPKPDGLVIKGVLKIDSLSGRHNIRTGRTTAHKLLGVVGEGVEIMVYDPIFTEMSGTVPMRWRWIECAIAKGWLCVDDVVFIEPPGIPPQPPPPPKPDEDETPEPDAQLYSIPIMVQVMATSPNAAEEVAMFIMTIGKLSINLILQAHKLREYIEGDAIRDVQVSVQLPKVEGV